MKQTLKSQIIRLNFLIKRDDNIISDLARKYSPPDHCCPSCACPEYNWLHKKNERRRAWLKVLEKRYEKSLLQKRQNHVKWRDRIYKFFDSLLNIKGG